MQPRSAPQSNQKSLHPLQRIRIWYAALLVVFSVFVIRSFYLQVIRHDYYQKTALHSQLKQYELPASRGTISAHSGDKLVPLVLNETLYTLFADPKYVKNTHETASQLQKAIGGNADDYEKLLKTPNTRYVILAKKLDGDKAKKIAALNLKGVGTRDTQARIYPDGQLASQVLGFVNDDGDGKYGLEQALDKELKGQPGQLKAITDAQGVPLPANHDNLILDPVPGKQVVLTLDIGLQQHLEDILAQGVKDDNAKSGSALIMDINTGAVKAMANYPTYDPTNYSQQKDIAIFNNPAVSSPLEPGSIMKLLTASAALDSGSVGRDYTYYDPGKYVIDQATVTNVEGNSIVGTQSLQGILTQSLNTGATNLLMQMGGGQINQQARTRWHNYMVDHFHLGSATGIEQGYEADGSIPDPTNGYGLNIQYANTAFGQGMSATITQMAGAVSAVLNGGTYNVPHLVEGYTNPGTGAESKLKPTVWKSNIVKPSTSEALRELMKGVYDANWRIYHAPAPTDAYTIGGKTGTAEITKPGGGYYEDLFNGTFVGYIGGDKPQYLVVLRVNEPHVAGYAGAQAAAPIFGKLVTMLINSGTVTPNK